MKKTDASQISLKQRIELELFRQYRHAQATLHPLKYISWETTLLCNLSCLHCGSDCTASAAHKDMPLQDFLKVLDLVKQNTDSRQVMIILTGGEPLMRKDIFECGKEFYNREFPWGMVTNGWELTEEKIEKLLQSGLHAITVSLDGTEKLHDWFRNRKYSFQRAINAIRILAQVSYIKFDVVTSVHSKNLPILNELKELLMAAGVKHWRLFTIFPAGRALHNADLQLNNAEFTQLLEFIKLTRSEGGINASYGCEGFLGKYEKQVRDHNFFCVSGIYSASVLVNGDITGCTSIRDKFVVGNIYHDNFWERWLNGFDAFRNHDWKRSGECANCSMFRYCEGNGMHLWNLNGKTPNLCHLKRIDFSF